MLSCVIITFAIFSKRTIFVSFFIAYKEAILPRLLAGHMKKSRF